MTEIIAVVAPGAALITLCFGLWHLINEKLKMRLDAYPKREAIFKSTEEFLGRAWTGNYAHWPSLLARFHNCTKEARFLFDRKLADHLDLLYAGAERHFNLETKLEIEGDSLDFGEKRALQNQVFASRDWLCQENKHLKQRFAKYLNLSALR